MYNKNFYWIQLYFSLIGRSIFTTNKKMLKLCKIDSCCCLDLETAGYIVSTFESGLSTSIFFRCELFSLEWIMCGNFLSLITKQSKCFLFLFGLHHNLLILFTALLVANNLSYLNGIYEVSGYIAKMECSFEFKQFIE